MKSHFPKCHMMIIIIKSMEELLSVCRPCSVPFAKSQSWETWPVKTDQEVLLSPNTLDTVAIIFLIGAVHIFLTSTQVQAQLTYTLRWFTGSISCFTSSPRYFSSFFLFCFANLKTNKPADFDALCLMRWNGDGKCRHNGIWKLRLI